MHSHNPSLPHAKKKHDTAKQRYEKLTKRLSSDRTVLENECDRLKVEWLNEERNFHHLLALNDIAEAQLELIQMEDNCRKGKDKFLPEFDTIEAMYKNKISQQENLSKQLRKEQRWINENKEENMKQRQMFQGLSNILQLKLSQKRDQKSNDLTRQKQIKPMDDPIDIGNAEVLFFS